MPSPPRSGARDGARLHAPVDRPPRILRRDVVKLTRMTALIGARRTTLCFTFPGATKSARSSVTHVSREHVPPFEGDEAWFEVEMVQAKPWSYWRAVRQVEPPDA